MFRCTQTSCTSSLCVDDVQLWRLSAVRNVLVQSFLCAGEEGQEALGGVALTAGAVRAQEVIVDHLERAQAHLARDGRDGLLLARLVGDP